MEGMISRKNAKNIKSNETDMLNKFQVRNIF